MAFDFEKFLSANDISVAVVFYGGPEITFDTLSVFKQNLFLDQIFEANIRDFEIFLSHNTDSRDWYTHFVQHTSIAKPVYIAIVSEGNVVQSKPILNPESISSALASAKSHVYVYSEKDARTLNRYLLNEKLLGNIVNDNHVEVKSFQDICRTHFTFDTLDEHIAYLDLPTGEYIKSPHYLYVNAIERLKNAAEQKALSFWNIANKL